MPECQVCGEEEFECHDGLYFCIHCQTQSQHLHELDEEEGDFTSRGLTAKKVKASHEEKKKKVKDLGRPWTTDEGFQLILKEQVKALISLGADPRLKEMVFKLWTLYLSKLGMAFSNQPRHKGVFTKVYPFARDIYPGTCEDPVVFDVRKKRTLDSRGLTSAANKTQMENLALQATIAGETFYEGDNPFVDEKDDEIDKEDEINLPICSDDEYKEACRQSSSEEDIIDVSSSGSNSPVLERRGLTLDNSAVGKDCEGARTPAKDAQNLEIEGKLPRASTAHGERDFSEGKGLRGQSAMKGAGSVGRGDDCGASEVDDDHEDDRDPNRTLEDSEIRNKKWKKDLPKHDALGSGDFDEGDDHDDDDDDDDADDDDDDDDDESNSEDDGRRPKSATMKGKKASQPSKKDAIPRFKYRKEYNLTAYKMTMSSTLALCYMAITFTNDGIVISDFIKWVKRGQLPYNNANEIFPEDMKFGSNDANTFCSNVRSIPTSPELLGRVQKMSIFLGIQSLPPPSLPRLVSRYVCQLKLPSQLSALCLQLLVDCPPPKDTGFHSAPYLPPLYEARAMAYIVVTLKLVFGLDGKTERVLSNFSRKVKEVLGCSGANVFVWEDWVTSMKQSMTSCLSTQMPTKIADLKKVQDVEKCLHVNQETDRAIHGRFTVSDSSSRKNPDKMAALRRPLEEAISRLERMKIVSNELRKGEEDPMELLQDTPTKPTKTGPKDSGDNQKFYSCTLQHITNTKAFLTNLDGENISDFTAISSCMSSSESDDERSKSIHLKKRRRIHSLVKDARKKIPAHSQRELKEIAAALTPAWEGYVLYKPGKPSLNNRHLTYYWLLDVLSQEIECSCDDIEHEIRLVEYSRKANEQLKPYAFSKCPEGLRRESDSDSC